MSTAEVAAAVERAFARQEGREPRLLARADNPVIGELASLDALEYELQRDTAAAGLGIRVSAVRDASGTITSRSIIAVSVTAGAR